MYFFKSLNKAIFFVYGVCMTNNEMKYAYALSILKKLYMANLLTSDEFNNSMKILKSLLLDKSN